LRSLAGLLVSAAKLLALEHNSVAAAIRVKSFLIMMFPWFYFFSRTKAEQANAVAASRFATESSAQRRKEAKAPEQRIMNNEL
jgi:hypothetical protein